MTPIPTNTSQPTATLELLPSPTSTPAILAEDPASGTRVILEDKGIHIKGFGWWVYSLIWSEDGKTIITGSGKNGVVFYNTETNKLTVIPMDNLDVDGVSLCPDKKTLSVGLTVNIEIPGSYGFIRYINEETGDLIKIGSRDVCGLLSPDGKMLIEGDSTEVFLWDIASGKTVKELFKVDPGSQVLMSRLSLSPDGKSLIAGYGKIFSSKQTFMVWDTTTWKLQRTFTGDDLGEGFAMAFSPDGTRFATSSGSEIHEPAVWDFNSGKKLFYLDTTQPVSYTAIAYDPSGKYIAAGDANGSMINTVTIYDANTGKHVRKLVAGDFYASVLVFSPDGTKLAAGGGMDKPGEVIIWNLNQP